MVLSVLELFAAVKIWKAAFNICNMVNRHIQEWSAASSPILLDFHIFSYMQTYLELRLTPVSRALAHIWI